MNKPDQLCELERTIETQTREPAGELAARRKIQGDLLFQATILNNIKDCVIATDCEGKITYWNRGACALFGYSYEEMLGESITRISRLEEKEKDAENQLKFLVRSIPVTGEWDGVNRDGDTVYLLFTYLPMKDKDGKTTGLIRVGKDITDRKIAEKALHVSEIRYRRLFEAAKDGVLLLDATTGQITDVNPYLIEKLGYSKEELVSKKIWEIGAFKDTELSKAGFRELQEKGYIHYESMPLAAKDGRFIEVEFVSNVYLVEGVKVIQCNIRDIMERKKAEKALHVSEIRYRRLFEAAKDGILLLDATTGQITDVNPYLIEKLGYSKEEFVSKKIWDIGAFKDAELSKAKFMELQEKGYIHYECMPLAAKDGGCVEVEFVSNVYPVDGEKVIQCNIRDITERKKAEKALRESEEKLTEQNALLEQKNAALREIMNQNRVEKERMEKQVQANVDHLLKPVIEKLKGKGSLLAERYTSLLEANLNEITSSFGNDISSRMISLTRKEIDICNMIKNGFSSKQISEAMNISTRTIETHRNSIRKKLDISGKEVNLETYLKFLP